MHVQATSRRGRRVSSARAFLLPAAHRTNLHIATHSHVHRVSRIVLYRVELIVASYPRVHSMIVCCIISFVFGTPWCTLDSLFIFFVACSLWVCAICKMCCAIWLRFRLGSWSGFSQKFASCTCTILKLCSKFCKLHGLTNRMRHFHNHSTWWSVSVNLSSVPSQYSLLLGC